MTHVGFAYHIFISLLIKRAPLCTLFTKTAERTEETQVQFLCETVDPCTPKNGSGDVLVCGQANLPCPTEIINGSSQDEPTDWYVCKREMDSEVLHDNTSVSGLESWWCVTTAVWFFLVLILLIVALTSVSDRISKSRRIHKKKSNLVVVSPRDYQLTEINEHRGNSRNSASDVFVTVCSGENGNPRKVNVPFKRPLSPINEITENSLDEDHEEEEEQRSLVTKQAHLHHRSNPSRSCHGTDGEL
nr:uncharacterized protein si:dkey-192k22.2 isoform X5 [Misgurnus anguillicaudatus]